MGYHMDINKILSRRGENMLKKLLTFVDIDKLEQDVLESGNPVSIKTLKALLRTVDKVQYYRQHDFLRAIFVLAVWKGTFSQIYRPIFYDALNELQGAISPEELERYCKPPIDWKINKGAEIKRRKEKYNREHPKK